MKRTINKLEDGLTATFKIVRNEVQTPIYSNFGSGLMGYKTEVNVGFELIFRVNDVNSKELVTDAKQVIAFIASRNAFNEGLLSYINCYKKPHSYVGPIDISTAEYLQPFTFYDNLDFTSEAKVSFKSICKNVYIKNIIKFLLMLEDVFVILNKYNVVISFNSRDVLQALAKEYASLEEYIGVVPELNKLIATIDNHKNMPPVDVIMQYYSWGSNTIITNLDELLTFIDNYTISVLKLQEEKNKATTLNPLNFMISTFHDMNLLKLLMPALGTFAHDNGTYHWNYTEFKFFIGARPQVGQSGCVYIDIQTNGGNGYLEKYAEGKTYHDVFESQLRYLQEYGGTILKFKPNCNFHKLIELTQESSLNYMKLNLHLDLEYVKQEVWRRNTFTILTKCKEMCSPFLGIDEPIVWKIIAFVDFKKLLPIAAVQHVEDIAKS